MASKKRNNAKSASQRQAEAEAQERAQQRLYESYAQQSKKQRKQRTTFYTLLLIGASLILFSVLSKFGWMSYPYERYYTILGYCCVLFAIGYQFLWVNPIWKKDKDTSASSKNKTYSNLSSKEKKHMEERALAAQQQKKK